MRQWDRHPIVSQFGVRKARATETKGHGCSGAGLCMEKTVVGHLSAVGVSLVGIMCIGWMWEPDCWLGNPSHGRHAWVSNSNNSDSSHYRELT